MEMEQAFKDLTALMNAKTLPASATKPASVARAAGPSAAAGKAEAENASNAYSASPRKIYPSKFNVSVGELNTNRRKSSKRREEN